MIIVSNLQFCPSELSVLPGTSIQFIIKEHEPSEIYPPGERKFVVEGATFMSGCLKEGDSYTAEVWESQVITCPFYPHMRCAVTVLGPLDNPQDSNFLLNKTVPSKAEAKAVSPSPFKPFKGPCSIPSSSNSSKGEVVELEQVAETQEDMQFEEIQRLFLSVKEECEKDHVSFTNFEEIVVEDLESNSESLISKQKEEVRSISSSETKSGVTFKIFGMGPKRNFDPREKTEMVKEDERIEMVKEDERIEMIKENERIEMVKEDERIEMVKENERIDMVKENERIDMVKENQRTEIVKEIERIDMVKENQRTEIVKENQRTELVKENQRTELVKEKERIEIVEKVQRKKKKKKVKPTVYMQYFLCYVRRSLAYFDMNRWKFNDRDSKKKKELVTRKQTEFKKVISKCEEELKDLEPKISESAQLKMKEFVTDRERNTLENQASDPLFQSYIIRKIFACNLSGVNEKLKKVKGSDISQYSCSLDTLSLEEKLNARWNCQQAFLP